MYVESLLLPDPLVLLSVLFCSLIYLALRHSYPTPIIIALAPPLDRAAAIDCPLLSYPAQRSQGTRQNFSSLFLWDCHPISNDEKEAISYCWDMCSPFCNFCLPFPSPCCWVCCRKSACYGQKTLGMYKGKLMLDLMLSLMSMSFVHFSNILFLLIANFSLWPLGPMKPFSAIRRRRIRETSHWQVARHEIFRFTQKLWGVKMWLHESSRWGWFVTYLAYILIHN